MCCHVMVSLIYIPISYKTLKHIPSLSCRGRAVKIADLPTMECRVWVRIPLETYLFDFEFSLPPRSEQPSGAHANENKYDHSPVVIVV